MVQRKNTGEFYIPQAFLEFMAVLAQPQSGNRVLDLSWRDDELLSAINCKQPDDLELWGASSRRNALESKYKIIEADLLLDNVQLARESFDIVMMNPPWGPHRSQAVLERTEIKHTRVDSVSLYLEWATWYLKPGALLIASVPGAFLHSQSFKQVTDFLLSRARVRGVFEFKPAIVFDVAAISTAIICLQRLQTDKDYRPDCFMAEIDSLDDLSQIYALYRLTTCAIDEKSSFRLGFSQVAKSSAFTSELGDSLSPKYTYFANSILNKLKQFPTEELDKIAYVEAGIMIKSRPVVPGKRESRKIVSARNVGRDGTIANTPSFKEVPADLEGDRFQLRTGDILIRTIQQIGNKSTQSRVEDYDEGIIAAIVPSEYQGFLYDRTLLRIRLKDQAPINITPKYIVQLFRNEFVMSGFNHIVLEQLAWASPALDTHICVMPSLLRDIKIPLLPSELLETPQVAQTGIDYIRQISQQLEEIKAQNVQTHQLVTSVRVQIAELGDRIIREIHPSLQDLHDTFEDKISRVTATQRDSLYDERAQQLHEFLEREMRERSNVITEVQSRLETYVFGEYWPLIDSNARLFLATGEFFYDFSKGMDLTPPDYGGIAVEFCKAVEIELWRRLGQHLGTTLIDRGIIKYPFWSSKDGKYSKFNKIKDLVESGAMLGSFVGFTWGLVKHLDPTIDDKYRNAGMNIQKVVVELWPQSSPLNEHGIPAILSELTQHRNDSAHKDKLERQKLEKLHKMVIPYKPEDSIIVQLLQMFPLPRANPR